MTARVLFHRIPPSLRTMVRDPGEDRPEARGRSKADPEPDLGPPGRNKAQINMLGNLVSSLGRTSRRLRRGRAEKEGPR
jgi:hypothetical protein